MSLPTESKTVNAAAANIESGDVRAVSTISKTSGDAAAATAADTNSGATKVVAAEKAEEQDFQKVVMGGSIRGLLLLFIKKYSLKVALKRKAFVAIGGAAEGGHDKDILRKRSAASFAHSRPAVYTETTMMGMVVFGTYDLTLRYLERRKEYSIGETPVIVHAGSGVAAGVARSIFWMAWERGVHQSNWILKHPKFCLRTTLHHACGYGALFGSYQGIRQFLSFADPVAICDSAFGTLQEGDEISSSSSSDYEYLPKSPGVVPLMYTIVSGGLAGQIHHVLNHYTSHWRQFRTQIPPLPRFNPTLSSFGTMALCFAAFEHGPQAADGLAKAIDEIIESFDTESN